MLNKFREAGVKHIFCGHYHRNAGGLYGDLEVIVTSAIGCQLGEDKSGMRIVRVSENKIEHKYYGLQECPTSLSLNVSVDLPLFHGNLFAYYILRMHILFIFLS